MQIESLRVKNFKALQDISLDNLPRFAVFVGRNGSGKSTLFRVFGFLKNCLKDNVRTALNIEGGLNGFGEVVSRGHEKENIVIEIKFRMPIQQRNRLVTYHIEIGLSENRPVVRREYLSYKRGAFGSPYHYMDFSDGKGYAVSNEEDFDEQEKPLNREDTQLKSADILAIKGLGQFEKFKAASAFRQLIENWHISDFHINDARGRKSDQQAEHISETGENLPAVARHLYENVPDLFKKILGKMRERVPGVADIEVKTTEDGYLIIRYKDGAFENPFIDKNVSDGTIKMFAYLMLLEDPKPFPILCIEEPENQLYPELMTVLAEEFDAYARRGGQQHGQVFVSTHSPEFLNAVPNISSIYWLEKSDGVSRIYRALDYKQLMKLKQGGDSMGALWLQGMLNSKRLK